MWFFRPVFLGAALTALLAAASCTVEPLNARSTAASGVVGGESASVRELLAATSVAPVGTRVGQQVRNELLFAMNGGTATSQPQYDVKLVTTSTDSALAVEAGIAAARAAQVMVTSQYTLVETSTGKTVTSGKRTIISSYDRTSQKFANQRAAREAENRAAKDVARQIRLALGQALAGA